MMKPITKTITNPIIKLITNKLNPIKQGLYRTSIKSVPYMRYAFLINFQYALMYSSVQDRLRIALLGRMTLL